MTHIEWQFGGWLRGCAPGVAFGMIAAIAVVGVVWIAWSYKRTESGASQRMQVALAALRSFVVLLLLLCLANPMRVESVAPKAPAERTVAVLVDRSGSMSAPDHRGNTRLSSALRLFRQIEPSVKQNFPKASYSRFAEKLQNAASLEEASTTGAAGNETHLFAALQHALTENPTAIICLTDGLETGSEDSAKVISEAAQRSIPIYFVPGENRLLPGNSLAIREVKAPARALRKTEFTATSVVEASVVKDGELPVELWSNGKKLKDAWLPVRAGRNTLSWPVKVDSGEPGALTLEFRVRDQVASCVVDVVENTKMEVLYYQGALQWGYRFLRGALESDPSFRMTSILNPALGVQLTSSPVNGPQLGDLPENVAELRQFQIVILAHVFADQLTSRQQQALVEYVRGGGGVLFISPDTAATERFSGTSLEQMLPVVFGRRTEGQEQALQRMRFQLNMNAAQSGGGDFYSGGNEALALKPFALPKRVERSAVTALFAGTNGDMLPMFSQNAKVRSVKPGAEVIAVSSVNPSDVLLARQQFGHGFAAALTTDLLWRWKLSLPSQSHAVEKFWQQLLLSLAPTSGQGLRLVKLTSSPSVNLPVVFTVNAGSTETPRVEALSPGGERQLMTSVPDSNTSEVVWQVSFTPNAPGNWEVRATDASKRVVRVVFSVTEKSHSAEMQNLPADLAGMKQLAEATGGALLGGTMPFQPPIETVASSMSKEPEPLWNSGVMMFLLLGFYSTELILRRRCKLL